LEALKKPRRTPAGEMLLASDLGREGRIFEESDVIQLLKSAIEREGHQGAFARRHGINRTYLNQILNRKKQINTTVMKALGLRKVYAPE
jgi:DNA-binding phage protein